MKLTTISVYEKSKRRFLKLKLKAQVKEGRQLSNAQFFDILLSYYEEVMKK